MQHQKTEEQALAALTKLCAAAEHSTREMEDKLRRWNLPDDAIERILNYLHEEQYVDDTRFCRAFIEDKRVYNGWGQRKIEQALYLKGIPHAISDPLFREVTDSQWLETLVPILRQKARSVNAKDDYERRMKLIRFAMTRGFSYDQAQEALDQ
ncbi:MAG: regulatory protein RecX [Prevotellaceae bacterium]|nr:regulatory protein RecX [Prevotellaceae bacterium]